MPKQVQQPFVPVILDRPSSPSDDPPGNAIEKSHQPQSQRGVEPPRISPELPANPPPTPQTPSLNMAEKREDLSAADMLGPAPPLSPPPSPPPEMVPMSTSAHFRLSETMLVCKRQAASVHGEWTIS